MDIHASMGVGVRASQQVMTQQIDWMYMKHVVFLLTKSQADASSIDVTYISVEEALGVFPT